MQLIISKLSKTVPVGSESAANAVEVVAAVIAGTDIWTLLLEALVCFCKFPNSGWTLGFSSSKTTNNANKWSI